MKLSHLFLVTIFSIFTALKSQANIETQGVQRYAIIAGANSGGIDRVTLRYADDDARSFSEVFTSIGGLEKRNNQLLLEPSPNDLLNAIDNVKEKIKIDQENNKSVIKPRVEFIFYYSGHSDEKNLLLGDKTLAYSTLRESLNSVEADVRVAILDSCASGAFTRMKGGQQVKPFLENETSQVEGYAYLASSSADEAAQESDAIGGAYFTHYLVSGLRGAADVSQDKKVTLDEAYQYAFNETLAKTQGSINGAQHAVYDIQLSGESSLVLTNLEKTSANLMLDENIVGRIYIRDAKGRLKVELNKQNEEPLNIGLEEGEYQITIEKDGKVFQVQNYKIIKGITVLNMQDFVEIDPSYSVARGSSLENEIEELDYKISIVPSMQTPPNLNNKKQRVKIDLNLFGNKTYQIEGVSAGSIYNYIEDSTNGALLSGVFNLNGGDFSGASISGVANFHAGKYSKGAMLTGVLNYNQNDMDGFMGAGVLNVSQGTSNAWMFSGVSNILMSRNSLFSTLPIDSNVSSKGVLFAGVSNISLHNFQGIHASGVTNLSFKSFKGVQAAGVLNVANDLKGMQFSGVVNIANKIQGHQFGLLNIANSMDGYSFGLINIIKDGVFDLSVAHNELGFTMASIKSGSKKSFSQFFYGKHNSNGYYNFGLGFGVTHKISSSITAESSVNIMEYVHGDVCFSCNIINFEKDEVINFQFKVAYHITDHFKPYAAMTFNSLNILNDSHSPLFVDFLKLDDGNKKTWLGLLVGVDI